MPVCHFLLTDKLMTVSSGPDINGATGPDVEEGKKEEKQQGQNGSFTIKAPVRHSRGMGPVCRVGPVSLALL